MSSTISSRAYGWRETTASTVALFTSVGTLVCCALPALLVTLGLGASLAGFIGVFPQIVWLSEYKEALFTLSGLLIAGSVWLQWRARLLPCPADPAKAKACARLRKVSEILLALSTLVWAVGFFFAFLAADVLF